MTPDQIAAFAKEFGAIPGMITNEEKERLLRFFQILVATEREECARVCEVVDETGEGPDCWDWHAKDYARAIRNRANNQD